jgi:pimeloyl-ACP methyl ester carboxylesterase
MGHSENKIAVGGLQVNLRKCGNGRPILFLHSAGGVLEWLPFFDTLSNLGELWVPDHPGFGKSDDPKWIKSVPDLAMYYLDFLDAVAPEGGFDLIGHSFGGWIAAEIAVRNSSKIRSLTLISPAGLRVRGVPMGDTFIWNDEEAAANYFFDEAFQQRRLTAQPSEEAKDQMLKNKYSFAKHAWHPRLFNPDLEKWLHRVKLPTKIIWGREDRLIPSPYADAWKSKIKSASVSIIAECGHSATVEKGDEVAAHIAKFLEQVPA